MSVFTEVPVLFTVSTFIPTMTTVPPPGQPAQYCAATITLPTAPPNHEVTLSGTAPNQLLTVNQAVKLVMSVASSVAGSTFFPIGLVIKQVGGNTDPTGRAAFPTQLVDTSRQADGSYVTTLTLWDLMPAISNFDFLLAIESNAGQLGVIDPLINNKN